MELAAEAPSQTASVPQAKAAGRKILIAPSGTRGDVQPFGAFGLALQSAGFVVRVMTNVNHVSFLQNLGLDAVGVLPDTEKAILENDKMRAAMASGDFLEFLKGVEEISIESGPKDFVNMLDVVDTWQPDLIITGPLVAFTLGPIAGARQIPVVNAALQLNTPSKDQQTMLGEPRWFPHRTLATLLIYISVSSKSSIKAAATALEHLPESRPFVSTSFRQAMLQINHPYTPVLVGFSPALYTPKSDWTPEIREQTHFTGFWVVPEKEQLVRFEQGDSAFGGNGAAAVRSFLAAGPAVYMGWGSMIAVSEVHMACLAVRALMRTGLRGIILGGWANLNPSMLEGQRDSEKMKEYARDNVLFMRSAPHEWLFPQCQAIVHHGGAGTTAAALRSGVPSVITPCAFDQFHNAQLVADNGVGVATRQFSKVDVRGLAAALKRCTTDEAVIEKAKALGQTLRAEDGLGNAVSIIDKFIVKEVDTGKWRAKFLKRAAEMTHLQAQRSPSFLSFLARCMCGSAPNDYSVELAPGELEDFAKSGTRLPALLGDPQRTSEAFPEICGSLLAGEIVSLPRAP